MNTGATPPMDGWNRIPWKKMPRNVFKLQKRIYQAARREDIRTGRTLQRLLMPSWSANLLAVRRITQDNQGKKTAGVDGVKFLAPKQRLTRAQPLTMGDKAAPVRRVWIPQPGSNAMRPLGIPTIPARALQALAHRVLEPAWKARVAPNSSGCRPGRSCHEAIEAIFTLIGHKANDVVEADIEKCFDQIDQAAVLNKINTSPRRRRQVKGGLQAGGYAAGQWFPTEEGTMQGGTIAPLIGDCSKDAGLFLSCARLMQGLEGLVPSLGLSFSPHVERNTRPDPLLRAYSVDTLLHLTIPPVAPLHCL